MFWCCNRGPKGEPIPPRVTEVTRFNAGLRQRVEIPHDSTFSFERTSPFSVVFWLKTTSAYFQQLVTKTRLEDIYRGWEVSINTTAGKVHFRLDNTLFTNGVSCDFDATVTDGAWHHVVVTYSGNSDISGIAGYIDGQLRTKSLVVNILSATTVNTAPVRLGSHDQVFYTGELDECAIYGRALTAAEAVTLYGGGEVVNLLSVLPSGLLGWWRMGEGATPPVMPDASGNGKDGEMVSLSAGDLLPRVP